LAISRRKALPELLTDVLVERGDQQVVLSTAKNNGARFSGGGFATLVRRSHGDDQLAACVGGRSDLPMDLFEMLLAAASEKVRTKLEVERKYLKSDIAEVVGQVSGTIRKAANDQPLSYAAAQVLAESLHRGGQLTPAKLEEFASADRFEEMVAALSVMSGVPTAIIERNMRDTNTQSLLVLAKAIGLSWDTTRGIMTLAAKRYRRSMAGVDQLMPSFNRLRQSTAQQILDFHRMPARPTRSN
jgi:uncharacterized protein (DUF2336 family)